MACLSGVKRLARALGVGGIGRRGVAIEINSETDFVAKNDKFQAFVADVANQERIREYDYGPGVGGAVELYLQRKNLPLVTARYRYSYVDVSNGSIYNGETASGAKIAISRGVRSIMSFRLAFSSAPKTTRAS